jgi:8-oxo-dGTP pyrophosphatase MutT (NUDIX family)
METAHPSAVAIIETPGTFVLEGRPDLPGKLAHSGKSQLFGGHCEEDAAGTIRRELYEEVGLDLQEDPPLLWSGEVDSQNKAGEPVRRHVSLFRVAIRSAAELTLKVPGRLVEIPKTVEGVEQHKDTLTPFALQALTRVVRGEFTSASE